MEEKKENNNDHFPHQVKLPRFINDGEIGLGDVFQRVTSYFGIQPCGGCNQRVTTLNSWMVFTSRKKMK